MGGQSNLVKMDSCKKDQILKSPQLVQWIILLGREKKKKKIVIWAPNDLNDKSEASHLYATFVREIFLGTKLQIVCWIKGYEN